MVLTNFSFYWEFHAYFTSYCNLDELPHLTIFFKARDEACSSSKSEAATGKAVDGYVDPL